ncbi:MAG: hypothetical protein EOO40_06285, partial [Deltaproteobacteria bacterium]
MVSRTFFSSGEKPAGQPAWVLLELPEEGMRLESLVEVAPSSLSFVYRGPPAWAAVGRPLPSLRVFAGGACVLHCAGKDAQAG